VAFGWPGESCVQATSALSSIANPSATRLRLRAWLSSSTNCEPIVMTRQLFPWLSRFGDARRTIPLWRTSSRTAKL